jgi:glycerophosphoryl diester phosphodiesterase
MSESICTKPDGSAVTKAESMSLRLMEMTYETIKQYDCGSRGNSRFPEQHAMAVHKPSLEDMVSAVRVHCEAAKRPMPRFNIEIKSDPRADGIFTPKVEDFAKLVVSELERLKISHLCCIQSFDIRAIKAVHGLAPNQPLAFLVENKDGVEANLKLLDFVPSIYSPDYKLLRKKDIKALHKNGIKVIPWTVNDVKAMKKLRQWGVDGIITDYADAMK